MPEPSRWVEITTSNPDHSTWYVERFRSMAAEGKDLAGEARFVDAFADRNAHILDAGCGPGRVGGELARLGHRVVGVDVDPVLIEAAKNDHPDATWLVGDLAELDLAAQDIDEPFDAIVCAGNVMTFLAPTTRLEVLTRLGSHLATDGRIAVGFGAGRDYGFDEYRGDVDAAGLVIELELASWDLRPFGPAAEFLVTLVRRP